MEIKYWAVSGYLSQSLPMKACQRSWAGGLSVSFRWDTPPRFTRIGISEGRDIYEAFQADEDLIAYTDNGNGERILTAQKGDIIHLYPFKFGGKWTLHPAPPLGKLRYSRVDDGR